MLSWEANAEGAAYIVRAWGAAVLRPYMAARWDRFEFGFRLRSFASLRMTAALLWLRALFVATSFSCGDGLSLRMWVGYGLFLGGGVGGWRELGDADDDFALLGALEFFAGDAFDFVRIGL
jgi:hypothetical protein